MSAAGEMLANVLLDEQWDEVADGTRLESCMLFAHDGIDEARHHVGKLLNQAPFDASDQCLLTDRQALVHPVRISGGKAFRQWAVLFVQRLRAEGRFVIQTGREATKSSAIRVRLRSRCAAAAHFCPGGETDL
jgi:hypothetical protein